MLIYKIVNKINNKLYIGQTTRSLTQRKQGHYRYYKLGIHTKLYDAMHKYGWDNFEFVPICICSDRETLNELEKYFIRFYDTITCGYNMCEGGDSNPMFDENVKQYHKQRMQAVEVRQRISLSMKAYKAIHPVSATTRQKLSEKAKGNKHGLGSKRPKHAIEAVRRVLFKSVYCVNESEEIVAEFPSLLAADYWWYHNGYNSVKSYKQLSNMIKKSAKKNMFIKGLKWFYK